MSIDREIEEKNTEKKYREKDEKKRQKMHVSGKGVFELQKLMENSRGKRILKLKKQK